MDIALIRNRSLGTLAIIASFMAGAPVAAAQSPPVDQAKVESEFRDAVRAVIAVVQTRAGDTTIFRASVQPFGPYDLFVLRPTSARHVDQLRNFFLGIVGGAASIDPGPLANAWHCGPGCATRRRDSLVSQLPQIRSLVGRFQQLPRVSVVARWPDRGFRVDLLAYDGHAWRLDTPSPVMGFVPWRSSILSDSGMQALRDMGTERQVVDSLVTVLRAAGLAAIARDSSGSIRVIKEGAIGDNEAGLLFLPPGSDPPSFNGTELLDGRRYVYGEAVAPGVYFYITT